MSRLRPKPVRIAGPAAKSRPVNWIIAALVVTPVAYASSDDPRTALGTLLVGGVIVLAALGHILREAKKRHAKRIANRPAPVKPAPVTRPYNPLKAWQEAATGQDHVDLGRFDK